MFKDKLVFIIIAATVLILGLGVFYMSKTSTKSQKADGGQTKNILTIKGDDWVQGPETAPITLVEYLDFECPSCKVYHSVVKQLKEEYKDNVRLVIRHFPLPNHKNSMASARSVEAAGYQGKFWEMYDLLFENQSSWGGKDAPDPSTFESYAKQIGLDMEKYKKDVASNEVSDRINRDKNEALSLKIPGTPTFFINGERIPNPRGYDDFKSLIDGLMPKPSQ